MSVWWARALHRSSALKGQKIFDLTFKNMSEFIQKSKISNMKTLSMVLVIKETLTEARREPGVYLLCH